VGLGRLNEFGAAHETRGVNGRLAAWLALVFALAGLNYAARFTSGKPAKNVLYQWGTAVGSLVIFALILIVVYVVIVNLVIIVIILLVVIIFVFRTRG